MADAGFFKGTSTEQDRRFSDKELKLLKSMKFPANFDKKVNMKQVNLQVLRPWIAKKIISLVGFEDDVLVEFVSGLLEEQQRPDPKRMHINLTGFLNNDTTEFMTSLWSLLLEAQDSPAGIPHSFVEEKKAEMRNANKDDAKVIEERERRRLDEIRERERGQFGSGRGGGGRGGRGGRGRGGFGGFEDNRRGRDSGWGNRGGGVSV
ncbi:hypothetical protein M422DRAFT_184970 [Sphaerobolus stellatus SS14]|uniref:Unplaced genomic scaffold SPHSTscaffold_156, whole genome shotgun sequence n=1 Tax=Sphaerobolus stellatus (strain SS14) TaxID=990650 RepID=A0A0C9UBZ4_SPHS4|nr:hypothetical protein M422DRAFT_184970 [Sphaerobolus stellatus SS14]